MSTEATPHAAMLRPFRQHRAVHWHRPRPPRLLIVYVLAVIVGGLAHAMLFGASLSVSAVAVASAVISVLPALRYGWRDMPSLICLVSGARYSASAIFVKAYELDALDNGLYAPELSFLVVLTGTAAVTLAAFAAHLCWNRKPVFREAYSANGLKLLLLVGFVGAIGLILVGAPARPGTVATGVVDIELLGGIRALMTSGFAIVPIAWLALNLKAGRPLLSVGYLLAMAALVALSLTVNVRSTATSLITALALFLVCFGVRVRPMLLAIACAAALFYALVISPAIVDVRLLRQAGTTSSGIDFIWLHLEQIGKRLSGEATTTDRGPVFNYYLKYLPNENELISRLTSIQELDYVVALAGDQGIVGLEKLWAGAAALLPSGFVDDKTEFNPDTILWIYGAVEVGFESWFEITPYGNAFTHGGMSFVFIAMFTIFLVFFLFFRLFCPIFRDSLLATFFIANYFAFLTGGSVNMLLGILIRTLPFEVLLFWGASRVGSMRPNRSR